MIMADVGQRQEELVVFIDRHQRRRDVAVHHPDVHDLARVDVAIDHVAVVGVRNLADGTVVGKRRRERRRRPGCRLRIGEVVGRGGVTGHQLRTGVGSVEDARELCARLAGRHVGQPGQRAEGEQVGLGAVTHGRVTITTADLLALDRAVHVIGCGGIHLGRVDVGRPTNVGSALLLAATGWVMVLPGHCTRNDWAMAGNVKLLMRPTASHQRALDITPPTIRGREMRMKRKRPVRNGGSSAGRFRVRVHRYFGFFQRFLQQRAWRCAPRLFSLRAAP